VVRGHADNILTPFLESSGGSDSRLAGHTGGSGCDPLRVVQGHAGNVLTPSLEGVISG